VILLIHGGCFQVGSNSADDTKGGVEKLTDAGFAVASMDYRLADPVHGKNFYPAAYNDAKDAMRWLRANGEKYQLNTDKIVAFGFSSGATLAAYLGTRPRVHAPERADGVIDFFGRMDFSHSRASEVHDNQGRDCGEEFVGETRKVETMFKFRRASVLPNINETASPFLICHGTKDGAVSVEHSELLFAKLQSRAGSVKRSDIFLKIEGADHGFQRPAEATQAWKQVCRFLKQMYGQ